MGWVRLDDQFFHHRKVIGLSAGAKLLFIAGLTHCAGQLTDGFISAGAARSLAGFLSISNQSHRELVEAGLWHKRDDGFDVHDYLQYHPTAEEERLRRSNLSEIRAAAGRRGGLRSQAKRRANAQAKGEANHGATDEQRVKLPASPDPEPLDVSSSRSDLHGMATANGELETDQAEQLAQRMVSVVADVGGRASLPEARRVVGWALAYLDPAVVDERIGYCAGLADPPRTLGYVAKAIRTVAPDWGVEMPAFGSELAG